MQGRVVQWCDIAMQRDREGITSASQMQNMYNDYWPDIMEQTIARFDDERRATLGDCLQRTSVANGHILCFVNAREWIGFSV